MKIAILGPISHWWECWDSPEHRAYVAWRQAVHDALVEAGHLVYRPDTTWKGNWPGNEDAQIVNDTAIAVCDLELNLTPPGVVSVGTEDEMLLCERLGKVVLAAPPDTAPDAITALLARIDAVDAADLARGQIDRDDDVLVSRALMVDLIDTIEALTGTDRMDVTSPAGRALTRLRTAIRHSTDYATA